MTEFYCTCWSGMTGGSFMSWFVNQHQDFPKFKMYEKHVFPNGIKHVRSKVGYDTIDLSDISSSRFSRMTNRDFTKYCSQLTNHDPLEVLQIRPPFADMKVLRKVKILYFYLLGENTIFPDRIIDLDEQEKLYNLFLEHSEKLGLQYEKFNVQKIINMDNLEYARLCDYIQSPPLDNWKHLIKDYIQWLR